MTVAGGGGEGERIGEAPPRIARLIATRPDLQDHLDDLLSIAGSRLPRMLGDANTFVHSVRRRDGKLSLMGSSTRYTAIVLLGAQCLPEAAQRPVLGGLSAADVCEEMLSKAHLESDLGTLALIAWTGGEMGHPQVGELHRLLLDRLAPTSSLNEMTTVEVAWALSAMAALAMVTDVDEAVVASFSERLGQAFVPSGQLFRHHPSPRGVARIRGHVGSFADQIYPVQALARAARMWGDERALEQAEACAAVLVNLQGAHGQWWWHYDCRTGTVVEPYPVYAVHQDAMAPMALFDLSECGGTDHLDSIARGLDWLIDPPEIEGSLVLTDQRMIWRKVGRHEPRKLVRATRSATTRVNPQLRLQWLDRLFTPGAVDQECRPYHLGWILYAWLRSD